MLLFYAGDNDDDQLNLEGSVRATTKTTTTVFVWPPPALLVRLELRNFFFLKSVRLS